MVKLIPIIISYFLGSIPFGYLIVKIAKGTDIRTLGSGNIGATNVTRVLGKKWGIAVFILDFLKGFLAPVLVLILTQNSAAIIFILAVVASICGHNWPVFLKFKGGKGVSTTLGGIIGLSIIFPYLIILFFIAVLTWIIIFSLFKTVSLASISSVFAFFIFSLIFSLSIEFKIFAFSVFIFVVVRHKDNIKKIIEKKEFRF